MPQLIRFMLSQFGNGAVLGLALAQGMLAADLFELGRLLATDAAGGAFTLGLFVQAALLFSTANVAVTVMNLR